MDGELELFIALKEWGAYLFDVCVSHSFRSVKVYENGLFIYDTSTFLYFDRDVLKDKYGNLENYLNAVKECKYRRGHLEAYLNSLIESEIER
jgi:hypothetical protein